MLRDYQQSSIDLLYEWMRNKDGNPCLVLPTGAGKSHVIAALCKNALQSWPETRILMLTHVKELIEQNAEKMRQHWRNAPLGIYSASLNKRELTESITFAGIQSVRNRHVGIGHTDICIIDEAHLISHKDEGGYRTLLNNLWLINPHMRVIGLTATPYRLGHGYITDKPALFDDLIEPTSIEELIKKGHLAPLHSKVTSKRLSTEGVHKRGGDFIESELQAAVDTDDNNYSIVDEVIAQAGNRKAWLFFCTGIDHAEHIKSILRLRGISAECITGQTPKKERERILSDFKTGKLRALTNCNVLTTGFDYPDIDLIAMLRPTMSPVLYVQMAGRGLRPKSHTDHCLVLDFAGVVETHGAITNVNPPPKKGEALKEAPIKACDVCFEIVHARTIICPCCGTPFPIEPDKPLMLHDEDIMGLRGKDMQVTAWQWLKHTSKTSGIDMLKVTYYGALSDTPVVEYLTVMHTGFAGQKARLLLSNLARNAKAFITDDLVETALILSNSTPPKEVEYKKDGKFFKVMERKWQANI